MKNKLILLLLLAIFVKPLFSQNLELSDVMKAYPRGSGSITNGKEIAGYYTFYKVDKADKKNANFKLYIHDANLNQVAVKDIVMDKDAVLSDAAYNGDFLAFKFLIPEKSHGGFMSMGGN